MKIVDYNKFIFIAHRVKINIEIITLHDIETEKCKLHCPKYPINLNIVYFNKTITSYKVSYCEKGFKYFIGIMKKLRDYA